MTELCGCLRLRLVILRARLGHLELPEYGNRGVLARPTLATHVEP
jgi:hypothetical protein